MASSGVIPLPPPPYPSIHYGPKPPWPPNGSLPPVLQKTGFLSPLRPGDQPPEKAEPLSPPPPTPGESPGAGTTSGDSQSPLMTKKPKRTRRKRCEKCEGCRTKDNCGRCSVCTNPNSTNSICKHRRCEVLTRRRPSLQTPLSGVQRNLFSASSPLFPPEGLNGLRPSSSPFASPFASPFLSPFSLGPPVFSSHLQRERPPTPVKDTPPRRRRQASSYQPYKTPIKDPPPCGCPGSDEGFYYTHLGAAESPEALREMMENRFSVTGKQLRLLEISFTGIEAKTSEGCPTAEWIIRRPSKEELFMALYRRHKGHHCSKIYTVVSIVLWEGISQPRAEQIYNHLTSTLPKYGMPTNRRCATNETKSCACQGTDPNTQGASYSFGCSWSVYYNGCKFGRSKIPRKFRLLDETQEQPLENLIQTLASDLGPVYKWLSPDSYANQVGTQKAGQECRLGNGPEGEERPFSGITCCMDFCAHSHYDRQNMVHGGTTVVCTILKKGVLQQEHSEDSEQLHVLPLYRLTNPPAESVDGIEVRPVESYIKPSPNPSRAPTPLTTATTVPPHSSLPPHLLPHHPSSSLSSTGGRVKRELAEEAVLPSPGRAPQPHPPATPTTTLSHDLSTSVSSPAQTLPRQAPPTGNTISSLSEDSLSSPPSVSTQGSAHKPATPARVNGHYTNGLGAGREEAKLPTYQSLLLSKENGRLTNGHHSVNGHTLSSAHLVQDSSTDSDSDYGLRQDSPQQAPPHHAHRIPGLHPQPPPSLWPGVQVKREPLSEPSSVPHPSPSSSFSLRGFNHQLQRSVSLEKQLERAISSAQLRPPFSSTPPPQTTAGFFGSPSIPGQLFMGQNSLTTADEDEDDEEEMDTKSTDRYHAISGGVAMALDHGSILIECAKKELHATTPIKNPSRSKPTRISIVFYQHKTMTRRYHGWFEEEEKYRKRRQEEARVKAAKEHAALLHRAEITGFRVQPAVPGRYPPPMFLNPAAYMLPRVDPDDSQSEIDPEDLDDFFDPFMLDEIEKPLAIGRVPKPVPLSQVEEPFYLELPVKQVDMEEVLFRPPPLKAVCYPTPFVQMPTPYTPSCHYSSCKPTNVFSGNWSRTSTTTSSSTRTSTTPHLRNSSVLS